MSSSESRMNPHQNVGGWLSPPETLTPLYTSDRCCFTFLLPLRGRKERWLVYPSDTKQSGECSGITVCLQVPRSEVLPPSFSFLCIFLLFSWGCFLPVSATQGNISKGW